MGGSMSTHESILWAGFALFGVMLGVSVYYIANYKQRIGRLNSLLYGFAVFASLASYGSMTFDQGRERRQDNTEVNWQRSVLYMFTNPLFSAICTLTYDGSVGKASVGYVLHFLSLGALVASVKSPDDHPQLYWFILSLVPLLAKAIFVIWFTYAPKTDKPLISERSVWIVKIGDVVLGHLLYNLVGFIVTGELTNSLDYTGSVGYYFAADVVWKMIFVGIYVLGTLSNAEPGNLSGLLSGARRNGGKPAGPMVNVHNTADAADEIANDIEGEFQ